MTTTTKAIVVGTGAGGLSAAAHLAKQGFDVLALDQAAHIGGFIAPFSVEGYSFDPGVHYIALARRGQVLDDVLRPLGIDVDALFLELDPDGFDLYRFPDLEVRMCRGLERYRDRLTASFPAEREGLRRVFDVVAHFQEVIGLFSLGHRRAFADIRAALQLPALLRWERATFGEFLAHYLTDPRARAVLAATGTGVAGLPPSRLAAWTGIGALSYYLDGAFYPRGGGGALRDALVDSATRNGARFRTHADVAEILVRDRKVYGVRLTNGERIEADLVISDADPTLTFGKLVTHDEVPPSLRRRIETVRPSIASFTIYLGMKRSLRSHGFGAFNAWDFPSWDLEAQTSAYSDGLLPSDYGTFLSSGTERDDSGRLAPSGCSTLEIVRLMPWEPFAAWAQVPPEQRGPEYRQLEQDITNKLLQCVDTRWPGLVGDVAVQRVSTPLSSAAYARAVRGGMYGPEQTPEQTGRRRFPPTTPIHGLFLTGSGVYGGGVPPCLRAGRDAAMLAAGERQTGRKGKGLRRGFDRLIHAR